MAKLILKRSSVAAKVPLATDLQPGELAVNLADAKLYTKTTGGVVIQLAPSLTGSGASGTWGINVTGSSASCSGNAATATNVAYSGLTGTVPTWNQNTTGSSASCTGNAASATSTSNVYSPDGSRAAGDKLPNTNPRNVRFDFANSTSAGTGGNYAGVMTYAPWDGTTASTGDASYQLAFGSTAANGAGIPQLNIRKGIDTTWNSWYAMLHSGNYTSYAPSLTGTGASGTWGINVTGSSASCSGNAATATNAAGAFTVPGDLTVGNGAASNIYMVDTDEGTRRIHCNSNRIGFLDQSNNWGAYCDDSGNWFATNLSGTNTGDQTNISGNAATATNVAYSGLTGTVPTWNQNTTGSSASCTGNAATATTASNLTTATITGQLLFNNNVTFSGNPATGGCLKFNQNVAVFTPTAFDVGKFFYEGTTLKIVVTGGALKQFAFTDGSGASGSWGISVTGSAASCTGNAATATNVAYSGLTGTAPTWNQNTTGSAASCTGNAASATTASNLSGLTLSSSGAPAAPDNVTQNQIGYNNSVSLFGQTDGGLYSSAYSSSWIHQIYGDFRTGQVAVRGKNSGTWQAWRTLLDSSNYTSYAPSFTGTGASGTWVISVTGSSASCTGNAATATNVAYSGLTGTVPTWNQSTTGSAASCTGNAATATSAGYLPTAYVSGQQLNPQTYFSMGTGLKVAMTAVAGIWSDTLWINGYAGGDVKQMCALHTQRNGTPRMYISNQASDATAYGTLYEFLTAYNYNTYAPTLTGTGASGTWGINVTGSSASCSGNAATATNVAYSGLTGTVPTWNQNTTGSAAFLNSSNYINRTGSAGSTSVNFQNTPAGSKRYQGDDANVADSPGGSWWHYEHMRHSNGSNYWGTTVAWGWEDNANKLAVRNITAGSFGAWCYYLNSSNYNTYAPTLTGTGASGTWGINVTGTSGSISGYNNPTTAATANTIVYRDSGGHLNSVYGFFNYLNMSHGVSGATGDTIFYSSGDDYIRKNNGTGFRASLNVPTRTGGDASGTWGINVTGSSASCTGNAATCTTATDPTKLPLTGGTVSGSLYLNGGYNEILMDGLTDFFKFRNAANQSVLIISKANTALNFSLGTPTANGFRFSTSSTGNAFTIANNAACTSALSFNAPIFYDSNNTAYYVDPDSTSNLLGLTVTNTITGSISGNAGTVTNGVYMYTSNTLTGVNYFRGDKGSGVYAGASNNYALQAYSTDSGSAAMSFHRGGYYAVNMGLDPDNVLRIGGWSASSNRWQLDMSGNNTVAGSLTANSTLTVNNGYSYVANNYGYGIVGLYNASVFQLVFAMGDAYKTTAGGGISNLYGIAWSHPNAGGIAANLNSHGALVTENGAFLAAISGSIRCRDDMRAPIFYDSNNTGYYVDPASTSNLNAANFAGAVGTGNLTVTGAITATGNVTAYFSDDRLKTRLGPISDPIAKIKALSGFYFEPNQAAQDLGYERKTDVGVSAQEVQAILPEIIAPAPIDAAYMTVRYEKLIPLLIEAVKAQQVQIEELKAHIVILQQTSK